MLADFYHWILNESAAVNLHVETILLIEKYQMELVLHIGAAKTGSTTIQEFLLRNVNNLSKEGIHLLQSPGGHNNRALAAMCIRRDRFVGFYRYNKIISLESKIEFDDAVIESMTKELSDASKWAHTVISTSEDYYGGLLEIDEIEKLRDILQPYFSRIKVVLYIRNQVETLSSLYSTFLKNGDAVTLEDFVKERCLPDSNVYNFFKGAEMWAEVFGRQNLCVRLFDRNEFDNGDLLEDFSNQVKPGLFAALSKTIDVQNQSLTPVGQKLALLVNRQVPAFSDKKGWNTKNRSLISMISRFYSGRGATLDEKTADAIEKMFYESNRLLHEKYFSENERLFKISKKSGSRSAQ